MIGVRARIEERDVFDTAKDLLDIKTEIVQVDVPTFFADARRDPDFPDDPERYSLQTRVRGAYRSYDNIRQVNPATLNVPFQIIYSAGADTGRMLEAALEALQLLRRRAPIVSGRYLGSMTLNLNSNAVVSTSRIELDRTDILSVGPTTAYANTIERGFYLGIYETEHLPSGIVYQVTQVIRRKYGSSISCRFEYVGGRGSFPTLRIAAPGILTSRDARPDQYSRRKSRDR